MASDTEQQSDAMAMPSWIFSRYDLLFTPMSMWQLQLGHGGFLYADTFQQR